MGLLTQWPVAGPRARMHQGHSRGQVWKASHDRPLLIKSNDLQLQCLILSMFSQSDRMQWKKGIILTPHILLFSIWDSREQKESKADKIYRKSQSQQCYTHSAPFSSRSVIAAYLTNCLIYSSKGEKKASVYYEELRALCRVVLSNNNQWRQRLSVWAGEREGEGAETGMRGERGGVADEDEIVYEKPALLVWQLPLFSLCVTAVWNWT